MDNGMRHASSSQPASWVLSEKTLPSLWFLHSCLSNHPEHRAYNTLWGQDNSSQISRNVAQPRPVDIINSHQLNRDQNTESEVTSRTSFHRFEHGLDPDKPLKELVSTNTRVKREKYRRNCAVQSTGPQSQFPPLRNSIHLQFVAPYLICICSSLLDLRSSEGLLNVSQGGVPVHLLEQLITLLCLATKMARLP